MEDDWSGELGRCRAGLAAAERIVLLCGAGLSAGSGVATFRGAGGWWRTHRATDLATPQAFAADPVLVWQWYCERQQALLACASNAAHHAIARTLGGGRGMVITQNVDGLQQRACAELGVAVPEGAMAELHGSIWVRRCSRCAWAERRDEAVVVGGVVDLPRCPRCTALLRPGVVWFGEPLPQAAWDRAFAEAERCTALLLVGTSGVVEPAASLARLAAGHGALVIEVNPDATPLSDLASVSLRGPSEELLPALLGPT